MVDTWESEQPTFQRTYAVAQHLKSETKEGVLLLGGADLFEGMFLSEPTPKVPYVWKKESVAQLMKELAGFVIIPRSGSMKWKSEDIRTRLKTKLKGAIDEGPIDRAIIIVAEANAGDFSSTKVRELIQKGLETKKQNILSTLSIFSIWSHFLYILFISIFSMFSVFYRFCRLFFYIL